MRIFCYTVVDFVFTQTAVSHPGLIDYSLILSIGVDMLGSSGGAIYWIVSAVTTGFIIIEMFSRYRTSLEVTSLAVYQHYRHANSSSRLNKARCVPKSYRYLALHTSQIQHFVAPLER